MYTLVNEAAVLYLTVYEYNFIYFYYYIVIPYTYIEYFATELTGVVEPIRVFADTLALLGERVILSEVTLSVLLHVHVSLERPVAN